MAIRHKELCVIPILQTQTAFKEIRAVGGSWPFPSGGVEGGRQPGDEASYRDCVLLPVTHLPQQCSGPWGHHQEHAQPALAGLT